MARRGSGACARQSAWHQDWRGARSGWTYFHYLAKWLFALGRLGQVKSEYRDRAISLAHDIHRAFVIPGTGVMWKMKEDLSGPCPGFGLGALDAFDGYVVYRLLDEQVLGPEIAECASSSAPGGGVITSANLTPANDLGIAKWTDAQVKDAITLGVRPDRGLVPLMAFEWYKNISADDLDALVAYFRRLKPALP